MSQLGVQDLGLRGPGLLVSQVGKLRPRKRKGLKSHEGHQGGRALWTRTLEMLGRQAGQWEGPGAPRTGRAVMGRG